MHGRGVSLLQRVNPDVAAAMDDSLVRALEDSPLSAPFLRNNLIWTVERLLYQWVEAIGGSPFDHGPLLVAFGSTGLGVAERASDVDLLACFSCGGRPSRDGGLGSSASHGATAATAAAAPAPACDVLGAPEPLVSATRFFAEFPGFLEENLGGADLHSLSVVQGRVPLISFYYQAVKFDMLFALLPYPAMPENFRHRGNTFWRITAYVCVYICVCAFLSMPSVGVRPR
jgi:hypothetical protein